MNLNELELHHTEFPNSAAYLFLRKLTLL